VTSSTHSPFIESKPTWATSTECYSAFARLRRDELLSRAHEDQAREVVRQFSAAWTEVQPSEPLREMAARVLPRHPLRAADALQLAAALVWADGRGMRREFVCVDERLREAAEREGFAILP